MIFIWPLGVALILYVLWQILYTYKIRDGVVENLRLTFGLFGHQVLTINGVGYATWMSWEDFPKVGDVVTHHPFSKHGMLCTTILINKSQQQNPEL